MCTSEHSLSCCIDTQNICEWHTITCHEFKFFPQFKSHVQQSPLHLLTSVGLRQLLVWELCRGAPNYWMTLLVSECVQVGHKMCIHVIISISIVTCAYKVKPGVIGTCHCIFLPHLSEPTQVLQEGCVIALVSGNCLMWGVAYQWASGTLRRRYIQLMSRCTILTQSAKHGHVLEVCINVSHCVHTYVHSITHCSWKWHQCWTWRMLPVVILLLHLRAGTCSLAILYQLLAEWTGKWGYQCNLICRYYAVAAAAK